MNVNDEIYLFYYDETAHSRVINLKTLEDKNFYDGFMTATVGWNIVHNKFILRKYDNFIKEND